MAPRHQRRKAAKAKREMRLLGLAQAQRSANVAAIVRDNLSSPVERNFHRGCVSKIYSGTMRPV